MNILVLNYEFPPIGGGASPVSYDISRYYVQRGHKVTVVTMQYKGLETHECVEEIEIYRVPCLRKKSNVCHPWEQLSYIVSAVHFLGKYLKNHSFDIVHTHFIIPTGAVAWYLKKRYHLQYVITAHGSDVIGHNNKRFQLLYCILKGLWRCIVRNAKAVVSPSNHLIQLMKKSEPCGNYRYIPNGIETSVFHALPKEKSILVMCRLQETKGVQIILRAVSQMEMQGWKLHIVGDGPYRSTLEQLAAELYIQDKVIFHGWIKNRSEEHLELLGKAAIYASASRVENCPVSILEALCSKCRVVVSDIPAHRELLKERGRFFTVDDINECAQQMALSMQEMDEMTVDAQEWDWQNIIRQYEKVLAIGI